MMDKKEYYSAAEYHELQDKLSELKTQINDSQKALADANKRWDFLYRMGEIDDQTYFSFQQRLANIEI